MSDNIDHSSAEHEGHEKYLAYVQNLPQPLQSHIPLELVNSNVDIPVYEGPVVLKQGSKNLPLSARILLAWSSPPRYQFEILDATDSHNFMVGKANLQIGDSDSAVEVLVSSVKYSSDLATKIEARGFLSEPLIYPRDVAVSYVKFLLLNFDRDFGRAVRMGTSGCRSAAFCLRASGWNVRLEAVEDFRSVMDHLRSNSGFRPTHVAVLARDDGALYTCAEAEEVFDALFWYLSFGIGRWCCPSFLTGFDDQDRSVWSQWGNGRTSQFSHRLSWVDAHKFSCLEDPFPGYMRLWKDHSWKNILKIAIHWYIEANAVAGSIEGAIVLTQTAFELLAAAILVEREGWLTQDTFDKMPASDRIRLLFKWANIPAGIDRQLRELNRLANGLDNFKVNETPDASAAMTAIRNTITHPTEKNRKRFALHSGEARRDAWLLGLRNLELCILRLFDYDGVYSDRIRATWSGEVEKVSWATF